MLVWGEGELVDLGGGRGCRCWYGRGVVGVGMGGEGVRTGLGGECVGVGMGERV